MKKTRSSIRHLSALAAKGNIIATYQLYQYYRDGQYVEQSDSLAMDYKNQAISLVQLSPIKLKTLKINGFRGLERISLRLSPENSKLLVITGENGAGKTAIIDAITKCLSWFTEGMRTSSGGGQRIEEGDIKHGSLSATVEVEVAINPSTSFNLSLSLAASESTATIKSSIHEASLIASLYKDIMAHKKKTSLPLVATYGVDRALAIGKKDLNEDAVEHSSQRTSAYPANSIGSADFKEFCTWFRQLEDISRAKSDQKLRSLQELSSELNLLPSDSMVRQELIEKIIFLTADSGEAEESKEVVFSNKILSHIKEAIHIFIPNIDNIKTVRSPKFDIIVSYGEVEMSVLKLSQGEKSLLAIILDITRRLVILNPNSEAPLKEYGIILIDEIDLHLHPEWQQVVVLRLQETFPNIQFIISTHSPQVMSTVPAKYIQKLIKGSNGEIVLRPPMTESYGMPSNLVLEQIMSVDALPPIKEVELLKQAADMIERGEFDESVISKRMDELVNIFGASHPRIKMLDRSIKNTIRLRARSSEKNK